MNLEEIAMTIVGCSGESRSLAYEALKYAKKKDFEKAKKLIEDSKKKMYEAHECQSDLIFKEANGEKVEVNILMIHAQDHLMNSITVRELIEELIEVYKKILI